MPHLRRLRADVTSLGDGGAAVAKAPGEPRPVLIAAGAVPGDRLEVAIEGGTRNAAFGRVLRVLEASPDRVAPRCPVVGECGGCPWQAMAYPAQLARKRSELARAVRAYPALRDVPVSEVRGLRDPYGYRTKIQMPVGGRPGALAIGFFRPHSHEILDVRRCVVQNPEGDRIVAEAREVLNRARIEPYDERRHQGVLRYLLLRVDAGGGRAALTLVVRTDRLRGRRELGERLAQIRGVTGVYLNVQPARGNVVLGRRTERLAGRERVLIELAGKRFLLSPTAFFQTNAEAAAILVERARAALSPMTSPPPAACVPPLCGGPFGPGKGDPAPRGKAPGPYRTLVDLYCGVGLFARCLAGRAGRVVGVEENRAAIADAEAGAALDGAGNISFVAAPAEAFAREAAPADAVIVDPPRAGCSGGLLELIAARLRPRRLVYVSCAPATLLRDLDGLARLGFRTVAIDPVDMFPHTPHLECVAAVERGMAGAGYVKP